MKKMMNHGTVALGVGENVDEIIPDTVEFHAYASIRYMSRLSGPFVGA